MRIFLAAPSGGTCHDTAGRTRWCASLEHDVTVFGSSGSGDNFNACWARGLAGGKKAA
jgi:hypothetical protein